jgi:ketosteroid isomerase-like protein
MRRLLFFLVIFFGSTYIIAAQNSTDSVRQVVTKFFDAMRATDTAQLRTLLTPSVIFQTVKYKSDGSTIAVSESVDEFLKSIARLKPGQADEQIEFSSVNVDGTLASVWTPYKFYFNNQYSHCGVNSFTLIKSTGQWQIQFIIDTRKKTNCSTTGSK